MYHLILQFLKIIQWKLLAQDDIGILQMIKYYTQHGTKKEMDSLMHIRVDWAQAILDAKKNTENDVMTAYY